MFNLVLYQPEIPPNTGNIIRLASNSGCQLHLIRPLGFSLEEKSLRRAGLDYHEYCSLSTYDNWQDFLARTQAARIFAISTKGRQSYDSVSFEAGDYLLFGPETRGLPAEILASENISAILRIPMLADSRSLNLSNSAALVVYEAWRQQGFAGGN